MSSFLCVTLLKFALIEISAGNHSVIQLEPGSMLDLESSPDFFRVSRLNVFSAFLQSFYFKPIKTDIITSRMIGRLLLKLLRK